MNEKADRMLNLGKIEIVIGVIIGLLSVAGTTGSWYVLPYRIAQAEAQIADVKSEVKVAREENSKNHELLIRMDERIKTIQRALKIEP